MHSHKLFVSILVGNEKKRRNVDELKCSCIRVSNTIFFYKYGVNPFHHGYS